MTSLPPVARALAAASLLLAACSVADLPPVPGSSTADSDQGATDVAVAADPGAVEDTAVPDTKGPSTDPGAPADTGAATPDPGAAPDVPTAQDVAVADVAGPADVPPADPGSDPGSDPGAPAADAAACTGPTCMGAPLPTWQLADIQPESPGYQTVYGLDAFSGSVVVASLWAGS